MNSWGRHSCLLRRDSSRRFLEPGAKLDHWVIGTGVRGPRSFKNRRGVQRDKNVSTTGCRACVALLLLNNTGSPGEHSTALTHLLDHTHRAATVYPIEYGT